VSDIVERLYEQIKYEHGSPSSAVMKDAMDEIERLRKIESAAIAFRDKADEEGLLMGCGINYPGEKEGKYSKALRKALNTGGKVEDSNQAS
jgi:hypothetical protein